MFVVNHVISRKAVFFHFSEEKSGKRCSQYWPGLVIEKKFSECFYSFPSLDLSFCLVMNG